jgi:hypothetical protein
MNIQPELFPETSLAPMREAAIRKASTRSADTLRMLSREEFTLALQSALQTEGISFSAWALMIAIQNAGHPVSIVLLSTKIALGYHAICNQANRTHWFDRVYIGNLVHLDLTPAAREKLRRVAQRIATHHA